MHKYAKGGFDLEGWNSPKGNSGTRSYVLSKAAIMIFIMELDMRLRARSCNIKAIAVHPGYTVTNIQAADKERAGFINRRLLQLWRCYSPSQMTLELHLPSELLRIKMQNLSSFWGQQE
jgi:NAD(P)-dependent dehydrogenase (short-subunit alcohol dehydrogenase family)